MNPMRQLCCLGYSTSLENVKQKHKHNAPVMLPGILDQPGTCEAEVSKNMRGAGRVSRSINPMRQLCCLGYSTSLENVKQKHKHNAPVMLPGILDQPGTCEAEASNKNPW
jgi:cell fate regulator YaaT (PSP1 superfamily)